MARVAGQAAAGARLRAFKLLRVLVSLTMIAGILYLVHRYDGLRTLRDATPGFVLLGTLCYVAGQLVAARRWYSLLHISGFKPRFIAVLRANTIGMYTSNFLPGVAGGDLVRPIALYGASSPHKTLLYASVMFERLCGIASIVLLATLGGVWLGWTRGDWRYLAVAGLILLGVLGLLGVVHVARHTRLSGEGRLTRWLRVLKTGSEHLMSYALAPRIVLSIIGYSVLFQLGYILMFWCFLASLGAQASLLSVLLAAPLAWLASMMPLSLNGLGVREGTLVAVLMQIGVARTAVVGAALLGLMPLLLVSVIGGVWSLPVFSHAGSDVDVSRGGT